MALFPRKYPTTSIFKYLANWTACLVAAVLEPIWQSQTLLPLKAFHRRFFLLLKGREYLDLNLSNRIPITLSTAL